MCSFQAVFTSCSLSLSGLPLSWAPAKPAAWRAAPWPAPCRWAPTCRTASVASPTRPASSASPAGIFTAIPAAIRSSTWPSRTSRVCRTTPAPCASPSGSWEAWVHLPPGISMDPTASCRSNTQGRSTAASGGKREAASRGWCRLSGLLKLWPDWLLNSLPWKPPVDFEVVVILLYFILLCCLC